MWCVGTHRYVWVVGGVAIKFPRVHLFDFLEGILTDLQDRRRTWTSWDSFKYCMLEGLRENIREVVCYYKTKHPLLAKLYLPLIIANVYRRGEGVGQLVWGEDDLPHKVMALRDQGFERAFAPCCHTFTPKNFAWSNDRLTMLDYGEWGVQRLIEHYGHQVEHLLRTHGRPADTAGREE